MDDSSGFAWSNGRGVSGIFKKHFLAQPTLAAREVGRFAMSTFKKHFWPTCKVSIFVFNGYIKVDLRSAGFKGSEESCKREKEVKPENLFET